MSSRFRPALLAAIVFALSFNSALVWQFANGALTSEFGGHPDEAAHYVTGIFVHDALAMVPRCAREQTIAPLKKFADQKDPDGFYSHYPKVGLGVWPPVFYLAQAAWEFAFGANRLPILLLMATLAATLATQLFVALREEVGGWFAAMAALAMISLPLMIEHYGMVMAEVLTAVFMFGAMLAWARFLDDERARDALAFGVFAGLAIMTKGTAVALALMAPIALVLAGQWRLLARPALWAGAVLTAIIAGPWTWIFGSAGRDKGGWLEASPSFDFSRSAALYYLEKLGAALGTDPGRWIVGLLLVLACLGIVVKALRPGSRRGLWASTGALIVAVLAFQIVMPVGLEARHILSAIPAALMFAVAGLDALREAFRHSSGLPDERTPLALACGTLVLAAGVWLAHRVAPPDPKRWSGFAPMAQAVLADPSVKARPVLVCSDATGEGMFISELAMRDRRPGVVVLRASKETAAMDWAGRGARTKFKSDDELVAWIEKARIGCVVVDASMDEEKRGPHHDQLIQLCENRSDIFWAASSSPVVRGGALRSRPARLYLVRNPAN